MDEAPPSFGEWLKERRQTLHLTQKELGDLARCSAATIRKLESGERRASPGLALLLAPALVVSEHEYDAFKRFANGDTTHPPARLPSPNNAPVLRPLHPPSNLIVAPTRLIGRVAEMASTRGLLGRANVRMATLTGPGGVGKTRLSLAVATAMRDSFVDGTFFVNLAPISDPTLVLSTIAQALEVKENSGQSLLASVQAFVRDKRLLLILDNFEQVLSAATVVADLLSAAPKLKVLVTSREVLHIRGEYEVVVQPLALPEPEMRDPDILKRYAAVQLFIEQAQAVKAGFEVTHANGPAVAQICMRLDGLPLAIELAAVRVKLLPPEVMLARLANRLQLLTGGQRDRPARHQTLRATIDWSHQLLAPAEQTLFARLEVFVGGWTLEAARAICTQAGAGGLDVDDAMASLVDKSLVRQVDGAPGDPRFDMLETLREFASERLEHRGETELYRRRHAEYFLSVAETAEPALWGGPLQVVWMDRLDCEHDNFRAALHWAMETGASQIGLRLAGALRRFWLLRGYSQEGLQWLDRMLALSVDEISTVRAKALFAAGNLAMNRSDAVSGRARLERSLAIYRELGDVPGTALALYLLGSLLYNGGDLDQAGMFVEESLALYRSLGDRRGAAAALGTLGLLANARGQGDRAYEMFQESLALNRQAEDRYGIADALRLLGEMALSRQNYELAERCFSEGLVLRRELGGHEGAVEFLLLLSEQARRRQRFVEAQKYALDAYEVSHHVGSKVSIAEALDQQGRVAQSQGDHVSAVRLYKQSLVLFQEAGQTLEIANVLRRLATVAAALQQPVGAATLFGASTQLLVAAGYFLEVLYRADYDQEVAAARVLLDDQTFTTAWAAGQAMTLEQATEFALQAVTLL